MPKAKKSAKQLAAFGLAAKNRWSRNDPGLRNDDVVEESRNEPAELSNADGGEIIDNNDEKFVCAFDEEDTMSFFIGEHDENYYYDSGNEGEVDGAEYIPHGMLFARKHNMLFEAEGNHVRFVPYNGDETDVYQVLGVPYHAAGNHIQSTVGVSRHKVLTVWSKNANAAAKVGIRKPKLTGTQGCRSVRDAILSTDGMAPDCAFPFFWYARTLLVANKIKGIVRRAILPEFQLNAPDCTAAFQPYMAYILQKIVGVSDCLTEQQKLNVARYADYKGYRIIQATGHFGPKVIPK